MKKLRGIGNTTISYADITKLDYPNESFDKVVAGNVIHLLDDPYAALEGVVTRMQEKRKSNHPDLYQYD